MGDLVSELLHDSKFTRLKFKSMKVLLFSSFIRFYRHFHLSLSSQKKDLPSPVVNRDGKASCNLSQLTNINKQKKFYRSILMTPFFLLNRCEKLYE